MTTRLFVGILMAGMFFGCTSDPSTVAIQPPSTTAARAAGTQTPPGDNRVITPEQLAASSATNVYDAVARLRPLWLRAQGSRAFSGVLTAEIVVIVDGQYFGDPTSLRGIATNAVNELRHLSGPEATNAYPWLTNGRHVEAAIVVYGGTRVAQ